MRVLHVIRTDGVGGCERHLLALLPELRDRGLSIAVCVLGFGAYRRFSDSMAATGIPTMVLPAGPRFNVLAPLSLRRAISRYRPTLVHTHLVYGDVYGQLASRVSGLRSVSSVHDTHSFYLRQPVRTAARMAWRAADRVIAISNHVARFLVDSGLVDRGKVSVVHYGIDPQRWAARDGDRHASRQALSLRDDDVVIGVASRLIAGKGHAILIEAVARALASQPRLFLLVAGDGPLRRELEQRAAALLPADRYRFLGHVKDVAPCMLASDVVAIPSQPPTWIEGFGLAALEAMACSRPVIATNAGSLPEVVADESTGMLVPPSSVEDLSAAIVRLASDASLRERMGRAGRVRAEREFTLGRLADRTLAVYGDVG